jgi:hypothetical protein
MHWRRWSLSAGWSRPHPRDRPWTSVIMIEHLLFENHRAYLRWHSQTQVHQKTWKSRSDSCWISYRFRGLYSWGTESFSSSFQTGFRLPLSTEVFTFCTQPGCPEIWQRRILVYSVRNMTNRPNYLMPKRKDLSLSSHLQFAIPNRNRVGYWSKKISPDEINS